MTNNDELATKKAAIKQTLDDMGLSIDAKFVPFSRSRNRGEPHKTLNWVITLMRAGKNVLTCDYSAGAAHCPGYAVKHADPSFRGHDYKTASGKVFPGTTSMFRRPTPGETIRQYRDALCAAECEDGYPMRGYPFTRVRGGAPIAPDPVDVVYSLIMDSMVLDYGEFESWAADYGYDTDSRKAIAAYRECLDIALKLRSTIGGAGLERLRAVYAEY